jgi:hypothetical protein
MVVFQNSKTKATSPDAATGALCASVSSERSEEMGLWVSGLLGSWLPFGLVSSGFPKITDWVFFGLPPRFPFSLFLSDLA